MIDSHAHLDMPAFDGDRKQVMQRAIQKGVTHFVVPSVSQCYWPRVQQLAGENNPHVLPAYGLHPVFLDEHAEQHLIELEEWLNRENAIAVGECGLDGTLERSTDELQQHFFNAQLRMAAQFDKPVIVHARKAVESVILCIKKAPATRGVVHCFGGSYEQAKRLIDLNYCLGFGGPVTYTRATRLRRLLKKIPLDCILLESDAPDQPPAAYGKFRNEPDCVLDVVQTLSEIYELPKEDIACQCVINTKRLFFIA